MENPDLVAGEKFGVAVNAGFYESAQAVSIAAEGVVGYNVFSPRRSSGRLGRRRRGN